jgi:hypothetical protein
MTEIIQPLVTTNNPRKAERDRLWQELIQLLERIKALDREYNPEVANWGTAGIKELPGQQQNNQQNQNN